MNTKSEKQENGQKESVKNIKKQETKLITENYQQRKPSELTN